MKIIQEHEKCIGCGSCVALCQKYWQMGDDGKAKPLNSQKKGGNYELDIEKAECNKDAQDSCPVSCIMVKE